MNDQQAIIPQFEDQLHDLSEETSIKLRKEFYDPLTQVNKIVKEAYSIHVTDASQKVLMLQAGEEAKKIKKLRCMIENRRKELKEESLRTGQAIDGVAKFIKGIIEPAEKYLIEQRDYIEIQENKRLDKIEAERKEKLRSIGADPDQYTVRHQSDEDFLKIFNAVKKVIEEEKEQERLRIEKEKYEAEERFRLRQELEEKEIQLEQEREERKRLEVEQKKREAEEKEKQEAAEREARRKESAPDKEKLLLFADKITSLEFPIVESREAKLILTNVNSLLQKVKIYIENKISELEECPF